jgi:cell division transport system ATP-binding protein
MNNKVIELIDVDIFQRENRILSNVNLEILAGELIYVIGKVGTGKSSLIKTFNAEIPLIKGYGKVLDTELFKIKQKEVAGLRKKLGVVFQDFRLLTDRNVYANLEFVLKSTGWKDKMGIDNQIKQVLRRVGVPDKITKMPHELSGGEQQRVVIARAILNSPEIILADEPTGNLDPETSSEILQLFFKLNKEGKTVIIVTHDYATIAQKPTRTLVCTNGIIEDSSMNKTMVNFESLLELNN